MQIIITLSVIYLIYIAKNHRYAYSVYSNIKYYLHTINKSLSPAPQATPTSVKSAPTQSSKTTNNDKAHRPSLVDGPGRVKAYPILANP